MLAISKCDILRVCCCCCCFCIQPSSGLWFPKLSLNSLLLSRQQSPPLRPHTTCVGRAGGQAVVSLFQQKFCTNCGMLCVCQFCCLMWGLRCFLFCWFFRGRRPVPSLPLDLLLWGNGTARCPSQKHWSHSSPRTSVHLSGSIHRCPLPSPSRVLTLSDSALPRSW